MNKRMAVWILLLTGLLPLYAQAQGYDSAACADPSRSMLWRVESTELSARGISIHLFGSIHVGKAEFYPLHPSLENLIHSADNLVFEVDPQAASDPAVAIQLQLRGMLPGGQTLGDVVSDEVLTQLEQVLRSMGIPMENFLNFKPWMIALLLTNLQASALGYDARYGLESYLLRQKPPQTRILELESMQQQLDMLETLDPEIFLGYSLAEYESSAETMESMVQAWRCGDKSSLEQIVFDTEALLEDAGPEEKQALDELYARLFTERNRVMAAGIAAFAESGSGSYFVLVGAGHLLGAGSVPELLQQEGFRVTSVSLP